MRVYHDTDRDFLSVDFVDEIEAESIFQDGIIVRYNKAGHVIGIDITDSMRLIASGDLMSLQEACEFLGVSESTMRRRIRDNKIEFSKEGNRYRFRKADVLKLN